MLDATEATISSSAQDLFVEYRASTSNGPAVSLDATPQRRARSNTPPNNSGVSVSSSVESVRSSSSSRSVNLDEQRVTAENHDDQDDDNDDESNEKTLVPSDGKQLVQALLNKRRQ